MRSYAKCAFMDDTSEDSENGEAIMVNQNHFSSGEIVSAASLVSEDDDDHPEDITDVRSMESEPAQVPREPTANSFVTDHDRAAADSKAELEFALSDETLIEETILGETRYEVGDQYDELVAVPNEPSESEEMLDDAAVEDAVQQQSRGDISDPFMDGPVDNMTTDSRSMDADMLSSFSGEVEEERTLMSSEEDEDEEDAPVTIEAKEERLLEKYKQTLSLLKTLNIAWSQEKKERALAKAQEKFEQVLQEIPGMTSRTFGIVTVLYLFGKSQPAHASLMTSLTTIIMCD